jgi:putative transposase
VVDQAEFQRLPPKQIVPTLADRGLYITSESTFYRVLQEEGLLKYRGKAKAPVDRALPSHFARAPNQLWSLGYHLPVYSREGGLS